MAHLASKEQHKRAVHATREVRRAKGTLSIEQKKAQVDAWLIGAASRPKSNILKSWLVQYRKSVSGLKKGTTAWRDFVPKSAAIAGLEEKVQEHWKTMQFHSDAYKKAAMDQLRPIVNAA